MRTQLPGPVTRHDPSLRAWRRAASARKFAVRVNPRQFRSDNEPVGLSVTRARKRTARRFALAEKYRSRRIFGQIVLVLYQFCTASVPTPSCFPLPSVLTSNGNQIMKSQPQSRNSRRYPASPTRIDEVLSAIHASQKANHARPYSHHSSLATRHCPIQSLAKHNRKPVQLIENKQQQLKSIASFCRVFRGNAADFQPPRPRHHSPRITTHQSLITPHDSRASETTTHGIIMLSNAQRASLIKSSAARPATGIRRTTKPASACGHLS
jgi:hypothetical protein